MVRSYVTVKAVIISRAHDLIDVERSALGLVRGFIEITPAHELDIAHVQKMNTSHRREVTHQVDNIIVGG